MIILISIIYYNYILNNMKRRITITIDKDILDWIDKNIEDKIFANRSHAFEYLAMKEIKELKNR
jgi:metal-responsive CopG/Arc/MetJ family transcriptional regulator